jgi:hypothetical protein
LFAPDGLESPGFALLGMSFLVVAGTADSQVGPPADGQKAADFKSGGVRSPLPVQKAKCPIPRGLASQRFFDDHHKENQLDYSNPPR